MSRLQEHTIDWFQGGSHNLSICLLRIDKRFNWNPMEDKIIILQRFLKDLQPHPASKKWASGEGSSSGSTFGSSSSHSPQHRRAWQIFVNNKSPTLKHKKRDLSWNSLSWQIFLFFTWKFHPMCSEYQQRQSRTAKILCRRKIFVWPSRSVSGFSPSPLPEFWEVRNETTLCLIVTSPETDLSRAEQMTT